MAGLLGLLSDAAELTSKTAKVAPKVAKAGEIMSIPAEIAAQFVKAADPAHIRGAEIMDMLKSGRGSEVTDRMLDMGDPVLNARLNEYLYRNADIPMDEASRMARANERLPQDAYHSTGATFSEFIPSAVGRHGMGVYTGKNRSDVESFLPRNDVSRSLDTGAQTLPVRIPDDAAFASEMKWQDALPDRWAYGDPKDMSDAISGYASGADVLSDAGYKGVIQPGTDWDGRVVFNPQNVRSRFARFDPRLSHLKNLSAGIGGAGLLGAGMMPKNDGRR